MQSKFMFVCVAMLMLAGVSLAESDQDLIGAINRIDNEKSLYLFGGLSVKQVKSGRSFGGYGAEETVVDRAIRYLKSHELEFSVPSGGRQVEEARFGKLKKLALPLLLALKFKSAIILPIVFATLTLVSFKALTAGLLAILFSGATLVKDLMSKKKETVTTAYISGEPINAEIKHTEYSRIGQASAQDLAYAYHTIPQDQQIQI